MKRRILTILMILCIMTPIFASYHDSYADRWEEPTYEALFDALKCNEDEETVLAAYDAYMATDVSDYEKSLMELHMVRYYMDRGMQDKAEEHYYIQEELYSKAEYPSEKDRLIAEFDLLSAEYYIWHENMGAGLKSSNVGKELFEIDPYEYRIAISEGFRLLSTPHIAGGSPKRGLKLFREIEQEVDGMNKLDRFSLYSGLGMSAYTRKEYEASKEYFDTATEIYPADPAMLEYMAKLEKKL